MEKTHIQLRERESGEREREYSSSLRSNVPEMDIICRIHGQKSVNLPRQVLGQDSSASAPVETQLRKSGTLRDISVIYCFFMGMFWAIGHIVLTVRLLYVRESSMY